MSAIRISVVIPTYQRPAKLKACLEALARQELDKGDWEVVVVNDGGPQSFQALDPQLQSDLPLTLMSIEHAGPAACRNAGLARARGELVAFTDDDCAPLPDWLTEIEAGLTRNQVDAVGGQTLLKQPAPAGSKCYELLSRFLYEQLRLPNGEPYLLISSNVIYRRQILLELGGFDQNIRQAGGEDLDLSHRLLAAGYHQLYWPKARVMHDHQASAWQYMRQQFRYGRGHRLFRAKLAGERPPRWLGQPRRLDFHRRLVWWMVAERAPLSMFLLMFTSQAAHFAGSRLPLPQR